MARVTKCDICGECIHVDRFKIKGLYVKKKIYDWDCTWWHRFDICEDCQKNIVLIAKERKKLFDSEIDDKTYKKDGETRC